MIIKGLVDEDFVNYKKPSMFIAFPNCSFKCEKECGMRMCQNSILATISPLNISKEELMQRYLNNPISKSVVIGGLEPFDDFEQLFVFVSSLRSKVDDDIVVYTGYTKNEIKEKVEKLKLYNNIVIKFGRYVPGEEKHYDDVLGVYLASSNQYAEKIS